MGPAPAGGYAPGAEQSGTSVLFLSRLVKQSYLDVILDVAKDVLLG
jgi:hypothetical protein